MPTTWHSTNAGTDDGSMPAKESVNARPIVTAGLANEVDEVNQYAAPDVGADRRRSDRCAAGSGEREDQQDQAGGGDDLAQPQVAGGAVLLRPRHRR